VFVFLLSVFSAIYPFGYIHTILVEGVFKPLSVCC